jgi:type III secretory pathway lipoprotein EscJ
MNRVYCLLVCLFCACQVSLCKELDEKVSKRIHA